MTLEQRIKTLLGEQAFAIVAQQQQITELMEKLAEANAGRAKALARINELKAGQSDPVEAAVAD